MKEKPNILVIIPDQLRRDALSCYGDPNIRTEYIDELARNGVLFKNACSTYPVCVPFRFTFMTGQYAHSRLVPSIEWRMSPAERTIADEFNENGYETVYIGKWHLYGTTGYTSAKDDSENRKLAANRIPVPKEHRGRWSKWIGFELSNMPFDTCYFVDDDPEPKKISKFQTDGLFDLTINYLKSRDRNKPFLCVVSPEPPHDPYDAPQPLLDIWLNKDIKLPSNFPNKEDCEDYADLVEIRKRYYAMIENLDQNVGKMLDYFRKHDSLQNTIILFLADHGDLCGAHGLRRKRWPYEESVGIPFIVYDLQKSIPAKQIESPIHSEDIFPTICGLAGIKSPQDLPGINAVHLFMSEQNIINRNAVYLEFVNELRPNLIFNDFTWRGIRDQYYKYIVRGDINGSRPWMLFDLRKDPYEMNNLIDAPSHTKILSQFHLLLREQIIETGDHFILSPAFGCQGVNLWK